MNVQKIVIDGEIEITCFFLDLIKFSIDESISNRSFFEHFKRMLRKLKLMKKSKSRDANLILEKFKNTI